jgi:hypothetical protein
MAGLSASRTESSGYCDGTLGYSRIIAPTLGHTELPGWLDGRFLTIESLGARPSNRCDGHSTSCCAPTLSVGDVMADVDDGDG